jgi:uncharacterized protein YegL
MSSSSPLEQHAIGGSHYGFSATRIDHLGATEYTLVAIAADISGSVADFTSQIEHCIVEVVRACRHSPRTDNLMLRTVAFDSRLDEIHGFKPLSECHPDGYRGCLRSGGTTALYDATYNAVESVVRYGKDLSEHDFDVNAIVFVITDGMDNASTATAKQLKKALKTAVKSEALESVITILVGVNIQDPEVSRYLADLYREAGFSQYVEIDQATVASLAKLADFASRYISAQSRALGSGTVSQPLTF